MKSRPRRLEVALVALLAWASWALPAFAQAPPPKAPAQSADDESMFRRGLSLYDSGNYSGAIATWEALRQSIGEQRGWKILYNLGLAYQAMGDATRAIERFDAFLREAAQRDVQDAGDRMHALEASHGAVVVRAPASGATVMTRVGSGDERPAGYTLWLSPGEHEVEVGSGTSRAHRVKVTVTAGGTVEVPTDDAAPPTPSSAPSPSPSASPAPAASAAPSPAPSTREGGHFPTAWVLVGAGLTVASAALPIALGLRASSLSQNAKDMGPGSTSYGTAVTDFQSARTLYYASYVVPGLLAAATATIVVVGLVSSGGASRTEVHAGIDPTGGTLWVGGRF
jgi:tetratricopeptide (TPR) repeat protein